MNCRKETEMNLNIRKKKLRCFKNSADLAYGSELRTSEVKLKLSKVMF